MDEAQTTLAIVGGFLGFVALVSGLMFRADKRDQ
jgi:hypothetical protein